MLTERDILDRHRQSLGEAHRACQNLARFADPTFLGLTGVEFNALKKAIEQLEGSARQIGTWRGDARWIRLGALYGATLINVKNRYKGRHWGWFGKLTVLFETGQRRLDELEMRTGVVGRPILPQRASEWLAMPSLLPYMAPSRTIH